MLKDFLSDEVPKNLMDKVKKDYLYLYSFSISRINKIDYDTILKMDGLLLESKEKQNLELNNIFDKIKKQISYKEDEIKIKEQEQITL